jgi:hypothetical protein
MQNGNVKRLKMFNVGDYVYANAQLDFDINEYKKPIIYHGIVMDVIQFGESYEVFYEILDQYGELNSFLEINVFDNIDKIRK